MASSRAQRSRPPPPPPLIGRAGNLTIFITPPPTTTSASKPNPNPAPVQAPPIRWEVDRSPKVSVESVYEFLCAAVAKAHHVHSSLDAYLVDWFGLDHSKYQRELNEYNERTQQLKDDTSKIEAV